MESSQGCQSVVNVQQVLDGVAAWAQALDRRKARRAPRSAASPLTMSAEPDESALMTAYAAGDEQAFDALFRALAPRLLAFFRRSIADRALCDDLVQATFVRLHAARTTYRPGSAVRPWLFTIAARVRIDELRRRSRLSRREAHDDIDQMAGPEDETSSDWGERLDHESRATSVREAIEALPPGYRMVIHLQRFEGLSFPEIGTVLGCSAGAARIRAFRAYAILRERLRPLVDREP